MENPTQENQPASAAGSAPAVVSDALLGWLRGKLSKAEESVRMRESEAETWRTGTNADWDKAAWMHPTTAGQKSKKSERLQIAESHDRIAVKLRHEVTMFRATIEALTSPNTAAQTTAPERPSKNQHH